MLNSVRRMKGMWLRNRTWLKGQGPSLPKTYSDNQLISFARFKEKSLRNQLPLAELEVMSEAQKDKYFRTTCYRGRRIAHYNHHIKGGVVHTDTWDKHLSNEPGYKYTEVVDGKRVLKEEVRDCLLIKPSRTALFKGTVPFPVGHRPQKYAKADPRFFEFMALPSSQKFPFDPEYHERISIEGSWPTQHIDFQKLCDPKTYSATYRNYERAIEVRGSKLLLPVCSKPVERDILLAKTNPRANPGLLCSRMFGNSHKKADQFLRPLAKKVFKNALKHETADISLWSIGGRNRRQKIWVDKPCRSRSLLQPEGVSKIVGLAVVQRVYDALSVMNFMDASNEIRIGGNDFHGSYFAFSDKWGDGSPVIEADISAHDCNCSEESMVVAWGLVRSMFPRGVTLDRLFYYFMSGFIFKNIVVPGRFVYRCLSGIPTGSPFTSLIVSLVNWLNWSTVLTHHNTAAAALDCDVAVFGDDTLVKPSYKCNPLMWDTDWWITNFKNMIGHDLSPCKLVSSDNEGDANKPSFLKTVPINGLPARPVLDTICSSTHVRRSNRSDFRYAEVIKTLFYTAPFNPLGMEFLKEFRYWLNIRWLEKLHPALAPPDIYKYARNLNIVSERASVKQYLFPYIYGHDVVKNVDLGNKPKTWTGNTDKLAKNHLVLVNSDYLQIGVHTQLEHLVVPDCFKFVNHVRPLDNDYDDNYDLET